MNQVKFLRLTRILNEENKMRCGCDFPQTSPAFNPIRLTLQQTPSMKQRASEEDEKGNQINAITCSALHSSVSFFFDSGSFRSSDLRLFALEKNNIKNPCLRN